jgi:hypothetical protein
VSGTKPKPKKTQPIPTISNSDIVSDFCFLFNLFYILIMKTYLIFIKTILESCPLDNEFFECSLFNSICISGAHQRSWNTVVVPQEL